MRFEVLVLAALVSACFASPQFLRDDSTGGGTGTETNGELTKEQKFMKGLQACKNVLGFKCPEPKEEGEEEEEERTVERLLTRLLNDDDKADCRKFLDRLTDRKNKATESTGEEGDGGDDTRMLLRELLKSYLSQ